MSWVQEFHTQGGDQQQSITLTVPSTIPAGDFLCIGVGSSLTINVSAEDSKGNTYVRDWSVEESDGGNDGLTVYRCIPSTSLTTGDTITITSNDDPMYRSAAIALHFDDEVTGTAGSSSHRTEGTNSGTITSGTFTPSSDDTLVIGSLFMRNTGRIYTPSPGWTATDKITSANTTGGRAMVMQWRYLSPAEEVDASGSYNSPGTWVMGATAYDLATTTPQPASTLKVYTGAGWAAAPVRVWSGSQWVECPVKTWTGSQWA